MLSIVQAKMKLPMDFVQYIYNNFNKKMADKILSGMCQERKTTFRINTLKCEKRDVYEYLDKNNIEYIIPSFYDEAVILKNINEKDIINTDLYKEGKIYLQSLSSMVPPIVLEPMEEEKVLDMTAAPGSKTTQIACMMKNKGSILANEIDKIRCDRLKYNIEKQGINIVEVINEDARNLGKKHTEEFDRVLLDTPCSGEGRFEVDDKHSYSNWSTSMVKDLGNLQKELIKSAYQALKPGGILVYSTCTLNKYENENMVEFAIKELGMSVMDIQLDVKEKTKGISKSISDKNVAKQVEKAIRIIPSENMEGFFICKLRK